jgi:hypothetical protein
MSCSSSRAAPDEGAVYASCVVERKQAGSQPLGGISSWDLFHDHFQIPRHAWLTAAC